MRQIKTINSFFMKTFVLTAAFLTAVLFAQSAHAQSFLEKMAKKAAQKAEEKTEQQVEKEMEKQLEKAFEEAEKADAGDEKESKDYEGDISKWAEKMAALGYSGESVPIEDAYTFTSSITMNLKTFDNEGNVSSDGIIKIYTNTGDETFAYEFISGELQGQDQMQKGIIIMDVKNQASIILNNEEGKRTGVVYGAKGLLADIPDEDGEQDVEMPENTDYLDPRITKTGRIKDILGYQCEEYKYKDEESEGMAWITKEIEWDSEDFMMTMFKTSMYSHGIFGGFLMASETVDFAEGEKTTYEVMEINKKDNSSFVMSDYQVTNLGSFKMPESENIE